VPALYVVATPIGNLEDISLRALKVLGQVKLIAAEDTRTTRNLLNTYHIKNSLTSYHEHNKRAKLGYLIERLKNDDVAIVSEAGIPGLSDTGYELVTEAINNNIEVIAIPGASALLTALVVSGLPAEQFIYLGFLPRKKNDRIKLLASVKDESKTMVLFESPHRVIEALNDIFEAVGDRRIAVCRELTKLHEEIYRGTVRQAIEHFSQPRGEFTLVLEGNMIVEEPDEERLVNGLRRLRLAGVKTSEAVKIISELSGAPRKKVYNLCLSIDKGD
jgi:16S rRNA (cytidine1402-2'-O)-methyltransferase